MAATVAALIVTGPLLAQTPSRPPQPRDPVGAIVGGLLGAGLGLFGGTLLGYEAACGGRNCYDFDGFGEALVGALVGEVLLMPVGVHIGNRGAGNLAKDLGVSFAVGAGVLLLAAVADSPEFLLVGAIGQIGLTVWAERSAGRKREISVGARVLSGGRTGVGLMIQY